MKLPDRIYLQWNCEEHDPDWGDPEPGDVTWSPESVFEDDVEYIRRDVVKQLLADRFGGDLETAESILNHFYAKQR